MPRQKALLEWKFREFEVRHDRGMWWYIGAGVVVALLLLYSAYTANYLFAVLIIMVVLVIFSHQVYLPPFIMCSVGEQGIAVANRIYPWQIIESFWVISDQKSHRFTLYCKITKGMDTILSVPLLNAKRATAVKAFVEQYVDEDVEYTREPVWEHIMRVLKL